jgi:hypothetical protein
LLIDRLGTPGFGRWEMDQLAGLIWKHGPRRTDLEREDFRQLVIGEFLDGKPAFSALAKLPLDRLVPAFRRCLREVAYERLLAGELGTLVKALDAVVRSRPSLSLRRGRIHRSGGGVPEFPLRVKRADGRYDHELLADAVEAVVVDFGGPTSKAAVARKLRSLYGLDEVPAGAEGAETPSLGLVRRQCALRIVRALSAEETVALEDFLHGRPLRETGDALAVGTTTVHRLRESVSFEIDAALVHHGLAAEDLDAVLRLVELMIATDRKAA